MIGWERAREALGFEGSYQRYPDLDTVRDLEEISDPHTLEDETETSWREWVAENKIPAVAFGLMGFIALAVAGVFLWRYIPLLFGNLYVQLAAGAAVIFYIGRRNGWNANQKRVEDIDTLELQFGQDYQMPLMGTLIEGGREKPPAFIPIKGLRTPGRRPTPYTVADIDPSIVERAEGSVDPDEKVVIRLHPNFATSTDSATGGKAVQLAGELQPTATPESWGDGMAVLRASAPNIADEDKVREITEANEDLSERVRDLKGRIQDLEQRLKSLRREKNKPVDERVDEQLGRQERLLTATNGRRTYSETHENGRSTNGTTTTRGTDDELEQVSEEVSADD